MKNFAIPALVAALALGACGDAANAPADETATEAPVEETTVITPTATETVVVEDDGVTEEGSSVTVDGKDVDATVGEDGVKAEIKVD